MRPLDEDRLLQFRQAVAAESWDARIRLLIAVVFGVGRALVARALGVANVLADFFPVPQDGVYL